MTDKCQFRVNADEVIKSGKKRLNDYTDDDFTECGKEAYRAFIMPKDEETIEPLILYFCDEHFKQMMDDMAHHEEAFLGGI